MKNKNNIYYFSSLLLFVFIISTWNPFQPGINSTDLYKNEDTILVAAHRGSHSSYPENSIAAIQESIRNEIDIVEIDIRQTKDGKLVLLHDHHLDRTTNMKGLLSDHTLADIKKGYLLFKEKPTKEKIPALEEVLSLARNKIILNLDFKIDELETLKIAADLITEFEMENSVIITINDIKLIEALYDYNPTIRIMPVAYTTKKIKQVFKYDFIDVVQVYHRAYPKSIINTFEEKKISIWVNSIKKYDKIQEKGQPGFDRLLQIKKVDIIQTNHPEDLLLFLREKGLHP
ncbi:glycerophosphodiester phosphodiesterase family protein [Christiangramia sediminis]|uniref:Glycerophosphodiester phosphodiesterase family protein n=1 Tax=Christiangramia sediminis TaxID=2881336 RepID=A0A9X1LHB0_9FLAO|nr:glycerophosphodiester phosphodiesterase family protein [Christiangramia sediminis]MCB7480374.1 glycerophosphodiester phosphodiesterase family protein [Christiangramia sediminis]